MKKLIVFLLAAATICACTKPVFEQTYETAGQEPFEINVPVPDGNWLVTVTLGGPDAAVTTIKGESRRLYVHNFATAAGETRKVSFVVNKRDRLIREEGLEEPAQVRTKPREVGKLNWDDCLTLEILGDCPAVARISIEEAPEGTTTVYLCGDSTVVDQDNEPWASWGQMAPLFFDSKISVANYAESGERTDSFIAEGRLRKIVSVLKPGDFVFVEFGHNDMKLKGEDKNGFGFFADQLRIFINEVRAKGANPVLVTPTHRRNFDEEGRVIETHADYPDGMRAVAKEQDVPLIELHDASAKLYEALGPERSRLAFVQYPAGSFIGMNTDVEDNTHFNTYGAYELAKCVVQLVKDADIKPLADHIINFDGFDPSCPDVPEEFDYPLSPYRNLAQQVAEKDDMPADVAPCYLFSYFMGEADGLHLAWSHDGLHWTPVAGGRSLLVPEIGEDKLMRDPSICEAPDGTFHMVWTSSWHDRIIGYASSRDLINWSEQKAIPVMMHEPEARNCWAPELTYDAPTGDFYIYWATTIPGRHSEVATSDSETGWNHRIYCTSTKDFNSFTDTRIWFNPEWSAIDAAVVRDPSDGEYILFVKNENSNPAEKNIRVSRSRSMRKGFPTEVSEPIHGDFWAEGPSPLFVGKDSLIVYYDKYTSGCYGASLSLDHGATWTDLPDSELTLPEGMRHGTAFAVRPEILDKLLELQ